MLVTLMCAHLLTVADWKKCRLGDVIGVNEKHEMRSHSGRSLLLAHQPHSRMLAASHEASWLLRAHNLHGHIEQRHAKDVDSDRRTSLAKPRNRFERLKSVSPKDC